MLLGVWGRQHPRARPAWGSSGKQKYSVVLGPPGPPGALPASASASCRSLGQAGAVEKLLWQSPGEGALQPPLHALLILLERNPNRKQMETSGQRRTIPSVTQLHGVIMAKRTFSSFEYSGTSFLNTSILDPISETGHKPLKKIKAQEILRGLDLLLGFI